MRPRPRPVFLAYRSVGRGAPEPGSIDSGVGRILRQGFKIGWTADRWSTTLDRWEWGAALRRLGDLCLRRLPS